MLCVKLEDVYAVCRQYAVLYVLVIIVETCRLWGLSDVYYDLNAFRALVCEIVGTSAFRAVYQQMSHMVAFTEAVFFICTCPFLTHTYALPVVEASRES